MSLKNCVIEIMKGKRKGKSVLHFLSYLYQSGVAVRNFAYDQGILKTTQVSVPVISIGNIVAGGTGKTPLVKFLAKELIKNFHVAILSRGYCSLVEKRGASLLITPTTTVSECGDEPFWLAQQIPEAEVWVGRDRSISAQRAEKNGADVIILDDGMQHRQLKRDFEVVVVDGTDPLGQGFFLPRGWLRDTPSRLKNADLIVVTESRSGVEELLRSYTRAPIVAVEVKTSTSLVGKRVAAFCAIGSPHRFLQTIKKAGGQVVASFFKPDHTPFNAKAIEQFKASSKADLLICTEKDFVKLSNSIQSMVLPLSTHLEISQGKERWQEILIQITNRIHHGRRVSSHAS